MLPQPTQPLILQSPQPAQPLILQSPQPVLPRPTLTLPSQPVLPRPTLSLPSQPVLPQSQDLESSPLRNKRKAIDDAEEDGESNSNSFLNTALGRCKCGRANNKACKPSKYCLECCVKHNPVMYDCRVSKHKVARLRRNCPNVALLDEAMLGEMQIWIAYDGGSKPGTVRAIIPQTWVKFGDELKARCVESQIEKTYYVKRMTRVEKEQFVVDQ